MKLLTALVVALGSPLALAQTYPTTTIHIILPSARGSAPHIHAEQFNKAAGSKAVHVPLKGAPPILSETMGGRLQYAWVPIIASLGPIKDGKLLALAVSTDTRNSTLPNVPTIAEAGF